MARRLGIAGAQAMAGLDGSLRLVYLIGVLCEHHYLIVSGFATGWEDLA
jgi:hypothetical protein